MKILIIEDEKLLADSLKTLLTGKGFQVEAVYDGETGADYALLGIYDLLILDVMMPGLDGLSLARKVRSHHCATPRRNINNSVRIFSPCPTRCVIWWKACWSWRGWII